MAEAKEGLAATLSRQMAGATEYTPSQQTASQDEHIEAIVDISRLERAEVLLLSTFERALQHSDTPELRRALKRYLPQAESCLNALRRAA